MFTESRKINLVEEIQKTTDEATLIGIEALLSDSKKKVSKDKKPSIYDFVGIISNKEAMEMRKAIEDTCETINVDDWK